MVDVLRAHVPCKLDPTPVGVVHKIYFEMTCRETTGAIASGHKQQGSMIRSHAKKESHMRIVLAIILITACSCGSMADDLCNRAESCNSLTPGVSVEQCVKGVDTALDSIPDSYRELAEDRLQLCIDRPTCSEFASCLGAARTAEDQGAKPRASDLLELE